MAVLAAATGLAHELAFLLDLRANGFAVSDLRLADVGVDLELAPHAIDDDFQVQLAHAGDDRLAGLLVGVHAERRVFLRQLASAMPIFSWSALVLGSTATEITGSGNSIRSSVMALSRSHSVSPV